MKLKLNIWLKFKKIKVKRGKPIMNKNTKIVICVLAILVVGMTLSVAFAEPVNAKKYKNKKSLSVTIKDSKKTIKVKTKYKKSYQQYLGHKYQNGKRYDVYICYDHKYGWVSGATNGGMSNHAKFANKHNKHHPITRLTLH
jgi:hypothetical protein